MRVERLIVALPVVDENEAVASGAVLLFGRMREMVTLGFDFEVCTVKSGWVVFVLGLRRLTISSLDDEEPRSEDSVELLLGKDGPTKMSVGIGDAGLGVEEKRDMLETLEMSIESLTQLVIRHVRGCYVS